MTGSMARKESAPERMGGVSEPGRQKQYLFTNRDLKRLIAPLIVEQILAVTVGMVDTMMVSSAGEAATSGVSLVDMINNLLINVFAAARWCHHSFWDRKTGSGRVRRRIS